MLLLAVSCGMVAANIYYAQPLAGPISAALGVPPHAAGLTVTMAQIGYGLGLLFVVPLGDLVENRRLIVGVVLLGAAALLTAGLSGGAAQFLVASVAIGVGSVAVQVMVPYAAHLAPDATRGRVVGGVTSGLMLGIMLARPVASFVAAGLGWHAVFLIAAAVMAGLAAVLWLALPPRQPEPGPGYGALLASMADLARRTPLLRRRAAYQACLFSAFSVFWTAVPLQLAAVYHLSQTGIALFALAGVAGAISAPIAGRVADRGWVRPASALAMLAVACAFALGFAGGSGAAPGLGALVIAAILLDFGMTASLVLGQRAIFSLGTATRSRLNGVFMAVFFVGGAAGSAAGAWAFAQGGWMLTSAAGLALPLLALAYWSTERQAPPGETPS